MVIEILLLVSIIGILYILFLGQITILSSNINLTFIVLETLSFL